MVDSPADALGDLIGLYAVARAGQIILSLLDFDDSLNGYRDMLGDVPDEITDMESLNSDRELPIVMLNNRYERAGLSVAHRVG